MFAPSAASRRSVCLAAFTLLCVLPTLYVGYTAITINSSAHVAETAEALGDRLGLEAELGSVVYPLPGIVEYRNLLLRDPESRRPLAKFDQMRLTGDATHLKIVAETARLYGRAQPSGSDARLASLTPVNAEAALDATETAADPASIWKTLERMLGQIERLSLPHITLECAELAVDRGRSVERLNDVLVSSESTGSGLNALIRFRLAGWQRTVPSEIEIRRDRLDDRLTSHVTLRTGPTPLPVKLLEPYSRTESRLGSQARFQGTLWLDETEDGWHGNAEGRLTKVDLNEGVTRQFPHYLSGMADLEIDRLRWADGRIQALHGSLLAGPGRVSASLLHALADHVGFELGEQVPTGEGIPYRKLALSFAMAAGHLSVTGRCNPPTGDAVIVGDTVLLRQPMHPAEVAGLIRALVPPVGAAVPVNHQSEGLMRRLPVAAPREPQERQRRSPTAASSDRPRRLHPRQAVKIQAEITGVRGGETRSSHQPK